MKPYDLSYASSRYFRAEDFDYASPLAQLVKYLKKNPSLTVLAVGVNADEEGNVGIVLTTE